MIIYVDILLFINTVINYAILMTTERLMKKDVRLYRILIGSLTGALFSFLIFWKPDSYILLLLLKVVSSVILSIVTFGWHSRKEYVRTTLCTVAVSTAYCGAFILFYQVFHPPNMIIVNDVVYLQVNPLWLIALTGLIYLIILLLSKFFSERIKSTVVPLRFQLGGREYHCIGKVDTGCNLKEPFSSAPVIIVDSSVIHIDDTQPLRIIPYTVVGGKSYLNAVKADSVSVNKQHIEKDIYIAEADLNNPNFQAIIHSELGR